MIVVSGGSLSSLGKGIVASSIGAILASTKQTITIQKFDPYLNVDPGTMNPFEHGETFVLEDGLECDLDLGNYERFLNRDLDKRSSVTSGLVLQSVLQDEREGKFAGKTVQIIPHVTDEICSRFDSLHEDNDIVIVEFGGTIGDIEGVSLLEAARIYKADPEVDLLHIHLSHVPYLSSSKSFKTKPAQSSIKDCMSSGLPPDMVICRSEKPIGESEKRKIALAAGLPDNKVLNGWDIEDIYEVPLMFNDQGLGDRILEFFNIENEIIDLQKWEDYRLKRIKPRKTVKVAIFGKYVDAPDAYKSVIEAVKHAGVNTGVIPEITLFDVEAHGEKAILDYDAVIIPGGFGERGWGDKIKVAERCFNAKIPLLGICLGMQAMAVAYARFACDIQKANSTEFGRKDCVPIIDLMEEQKTRKNFGGTLRVGSYYADLQEGSHVSELYNDLKVSERHRHRYELSLVNAKKLKGLTASGVSPNGELVEFIEYSGQFWVGCQGHPELKSRPFKPAPLFVGLLAAAKNN